MNAMNFVAKCAKGCVNYTKECYNELAHKTTWPTYKQLTHMAVVVLAATLVVALVVFAMDSIFRFVMSQIYSL